MAGDKKYPFKEILIAIKYSLLTFKHYFKIKLRKLNMSILF